MQLPEPDRKFPSGRAFQPSVDPALLWRSGQYAKALRRLRTAIIRNGGLLLLVGEAGTGKTILSNALLADLAGRDVKVCKLPSSGLSSLDFRLAIADAWGLTSGLGTSEAFLREFARFLDESGARGQPVLLVVDDAQNLSCEVSAEIGQLLEVGAPAASAGSGVFSTLLVGEEKLEAILHEPINAALSRRLKVRYRLVALKAGQVGGYCLHHLDLARLDPDFFPPDVLREVAAVSRGIPRLIDLVCSRALALADLHRMPVPNTALISECAEQTLALEPARLEATPTVPRRRWTRGRQTKPAMLMVARIVHEWSRAGWSWARRPLLAAEGIAGVWSRAAGEQTKLAILGLERTARMWRRAGGEQTQLAVLAVERTVRKWSRLAAEQVKLAVVAANQRSRMGAKQSRLTVRAVCHRIWERAGKIQLRQLPAVVGLASLTLTFAYAHRLLGHVHHESTAMEFVVPGTETHGIEPVAVRPTMRVPSVDSAVIPPASPGTELPPRPPEADPKQTISPPNSRSEPVDGPKKRRPATRVPRPGRTLKEARPPEGAPATSSSRPIESIRHEAQQDPGAVIDWLLKAAPRRGD